MNNSIKIVPKYILQKIYTIKELVNTPDIYYNTDLETLAFNRDVVFIGDPASIRTLASSPLHFICSNISCLY